MHSPQALKCKLTHYPFGNTVAKWQSLMHSESMDNKGFDGDAFYRALEITVADRKVSWKQVAEETGVSASTLTRMAQGRRPDAGSLAALAAWAGLNPTDFVEASFKAQRPAALAQISTLLRSDPELDAQSAEAVETIVRAAYERLRKTRE